MFNISFLIPSPVLKVNSNRCHFFEMPSISLLPFLSSVLPFLPTSWAALTHFPPTVLQLLFSKAHFSFLIKPALRKSRSKFMGKKYSYPDYLLPEFLLLQIKHIFSFYFYTQLLPIQARTVKKNIRCNYKPKIESPTP